MSSKYMTREQQIEDLNRRIETLTNRRDELIAKGKDLERKKRTHRLIQTGAEVESVLGSPIEDEDLPKFRKFLSNFDEKMNKN